ncbi:MAG: hypothetical protein M3Z41_08295 [Candidatus Eremiobacteraeota bacterium]|nr:hypothetical protein [Candidatus Eremiobacteraeota bacterium]
MHARTIAAAVLTFAAVSLLVTEIVSWPQSARLRPAVAQAAQCSIQLSAVEAADRAVGLRDGDELQLPQMDMAARLAIIFHYTPTQAARAGETIRLVVQRGNQRLTIPYVLRHTDSLTRFFAQLGFKLFVLAVGMLVLWRGRDRASLMLGIWCVGVGVALPDAWWGALPTGGRLFGGAVTAALWTYSPFMLYLVVESIATGVSTRAIVVARALMLLTIVPAIVVQALNTTAQGFTGCAPVYLSPLLVNAAFASSQLVIIGFFAVSYLRTTALARQRLRWVFWAFLVSRFGVLLNLLNRLAPHPIHLSGVEWLTVMIFPAGCAYAILRHRIIDVNFVLNRTLVYTILTTVVIGLFVLLENILNAFAAGRGVGLAVELAAALGVGLSFRALHKKIEGGIERTLFRRKHEAAVALQQLSEEAAFMESPDALLERATTEIPRAVGASGAAIYERRASGYQLVAGGGLGPLPAEVGVDDQAFVRLRKHLSHVDLADITSVLGTDAVAFALAIRGQLIGALVCGRRAHGEHYAPDEIALLRNVVHEIGAELHAIRARQHAELLDAIMAGKIDMQTARARFETIGTTVADEGVGFGPN